jgi:hypothetical protein
LFQTGIDRINFFCTVGDQFLYFRRQRLALALSIVPNKSRLPRESIFTEAAYPLDRNL